jgi:hypothetical protein
MEQIQKAVAADHLIFSHSFLTVMILILFHSAALLSDGQQETRR